MTLRTKSEQKAYLDGYEMCAECIENYLTGKGKQILECLLMAVRTAVGIEDLEPKADRVKTELNGVKTELEPCEDCISRNAVHDMLENLPVTVEDKWFNWLQKACLRLAEMPSVQPKTDNDCISRQAVTKVLNTMDRYVSEELTLCDTNKKFPANEVFIVDDVYEEIVEQLPSVQQETILDKIRTIIEEWKNDSWTDGLSYECMVKIAGLLENEG